MKLIMPYKRQNKIQCEYGKHSTRFFHKKFMLMDILLKQCGRQEFLDPGESVVLISKLKKINKLANKKIQLILTDKPQLICVDPSKMVAKGNIIWSDDPSELSVQVSDSSHFRICTVFI
jgi:hypothetical protein